MRLQVGGRVGVSFQVDERDTRRKESRGATESTPLGGRLDHAHIPPCV